MTSWALVACQTNTQQLDSQSETNSEVSSAESTDCRTVQHEMGDTEICGQPQTIVVLGPYLLEQVLALGAQPAGYGDHIAFHQGDYDNPSQQIPYLGNKVTTQPVNVGLAYQPSIEAIVKAQPDLILAPGLEATQYEQLTTIAPTLSLNIVGGNTNLSAIGQALGLSDRADALLAETNTRIEQAKAQFAPVVKNHPQVLMLTSGDMQAFNTISHTNSRCGALVQDLGFQPVYLEDVAADDPTSVAEISIEALPELDDADSILLFGYDWETSSLTDMTAFEQQQTQTLKQAWEKNAIAQSLTASKAGRVYFIPAYLCLGLPGPIGTELYLNELQIQLQP
ncbi:iron-siderophore ABC transporter substrate-binding protein [Leptothoe sp. LEGE 181152]|nr:iron-siderophore ABC transporter substrate-binding protein [Leptothoe sp. LEGE 181152]